MEQLVFLKASENLTRSIKMQTMHIENKKKPTEKKPTIEIKKITLIDHNKDRAFQPLLRRKDTMSFIATQSKRPGV